MKQDFRNRIKELAENTKLTNAQIAKKLGCSKRTVRRHAGPYADKHMRVAGIGEILRSNFGDVPFDPKKSGLPDRDDPIFSPLCLLQEKLAG